MRYTIIIASFLLILLSNCKHEPNEIPLPDVIVSNPGNGNVIDSICYADSISPLLNSSCANSGCHDDINHQSGINLSSYQNVISTISGNLLMQVIQDTGPLGMPAASSGVPKLSLAQIALIKRWVNEGMKEGIDCGNCPLDTINITFSGTIFPLIQSNCLGCHSSTGTNLIGYDSIYKQVINGKLNCTVNHLSGCLPMPQNGQMLCPGKIAQIKKWIDSGAPNN